MGQELPFAEVLEAADHLSFEEQEALVEIMQRRVAERGRKRIAADIREARQEFAQGRCKTSSVDRMLDDFVP